jgi:hypothetical protein
MVGYPETIATYTSDLTKMSLFLFFATNIRIHSPDQIKSLLPYSAPFAPSSLRK